MYVAETDDSTAKQATGDFVFCQNLVLAPLAKSDCGVAWAGVRWSIKSLNPNADRTSLGGYIIQKVTIALNIKSCPEYGDRDINVRTFSFYEAWKIVNGNVLWGEGPGPHQNDAFKIGEVLAVVTGRGDPLR